jgi:TonB family protein
MMEFLTYDLKVAVLVVVFYMFYRLLLSRETFHRINRMVLLGTAIASFVLPLCVITLHKTVVVSGGGGTVTFDNFSPIATEVLEVAEPQTPLWQTLVVVVFFAGLVLTLGHTIVGIVKVWRLISRSERYRQSDGTIICVADRDVSPFSWMNYIVLSHSDYEAQDASVLAHERGHIRLHHSVDVLLVDILTALQWFNPAMWMLRQDLRSIHEYEADAAVLSQGINMRQYQYLLIQKAVSDCGYSVVNGITHSTLKNRIHMMLNNKKTNRASWLKLLALLPIVGVALALNAETVNDYVYEDTQQQQQKKIVKKGRKEAQVKMNDTTIEVKTEAEPADDRPYALHAVVDQFGRITGLSSEGKPDPRQPLEFTIGRIFFDDRVATLEEVKNYKSLGYELFEIIHRPNSAGDPKWNYKDKEGILVFHQKKQEAKDAPKLIFGESNGPEPLLVLDGKVITQEQAKALDQSTIDHMTVMKNEEALKTYAKHFNADTSNGIIFINTKDYVKNGKKELVSVRVEREKPQGGGIIFDVVEQMPEFSGGMNEMMKYLSMNVRYPEAAKKAGKDGRVVVQFVVEADGSISNAKVVRSVNEELDAEAVRVIEKMPNWKPGMQNGKAVRVRYNIPIAFRLNSTMKEEPKDKVESSALTVVGY